MISPNGTSGVTPNSEPYSVPVGNMAISLDTRASEQSSLEGGLNGITFILILK